MTRTQIIHEYNDMIVFEAENYASQSGYSVVNQNDASGGLVMRADGPTGSKLNFNIFVVNPGVWYVWVRTCATDHLNNGMFLQLDNQPVCAPADHPQAGGTAIYLSKGGWSWKPEWLLDEKHSGPVTINLEAGNHVISIVKRLVENPLIDKVVLTRQDTPPTNFGPPVSERPLPPSRILATRGWTQQILVSWEDPSVPKSMSYEVWRRASNVVKANLIATSTSTSYSDLSASVGVTYYYWVRSVNQAGCGEFSPRATGIRSSMLLKNEKAYGPISDIQGSSRYFRINVPVGKKQLFIQTWGDAGVNGQSGNINLYARYVGLPSLTNYTDRSISDGNVHSVTIDNPSVGFWYIMIHGYSNYSGVIIRASIIE